MNIIFGFLVVISIITLLFTSPEKVLSCFLSGGEKAFSLSIKLLVIYAVWMGMFEILERTRLSNKFAKALKPVNKMLFGKIPDGCEDFISMNITANALGMSGATTPMGIKAVTALDKHPNTSYITAMFFVINATSVQIIPSSVLALRTSLNSTSPQDIILPTILATLLSTIIGVLLVKIFIKQPKL